MMKGERGEPLRQGGRERHGGFEPQNIEQGMSNDEVVLVGETILWQSFLRLKEGE